mmetsp:Transcript_42657/g.109859  ORF Transcript_42657/g.109859 Transcript_42657/m.109859 type:complete len:161 (-) Transcript_42657:405-887(-)
MAQSATSTSSTPIAFPSALRLCFIFASIRPPFFCFPFSFFFFFTYFCLLVFEVRQEDDMIRIRSYHLAAFLFAHTCYFDLKCRVEGRRVRRGRREEKRQGECACLRLAFFCLPGLPIYPPTRAPIAKHNRLVFAFAIGLVDERCTRCEEEARLEMATSPR